MNKYEKWDEDARRTLAENLKVCKAEPVISCSECGKDLDLDDEDTDIYANVDEESDELICLDCFLRK